MGVGSGGEKPTHMDMELIPLYAQGASPSRKPQISSGPYYTARYPHLDISVTIVTTSFV